MTGPPSQGLTINGVEVDLAAEVLRDGHGVAVPMRRQAFAVLRHLLGNPGRLVAKDELMAAVWPGIAVTDDSLVQCIHEIRRALHDEPHMVLRTVPRRGYRLVLPAARRPAAPVASPPLADRPRPPSRRRCFWGSSPPGGAARRRFRPGCRLPCCRSTTSMATRARSGSPPPSPRI